MPYMARSVSRITRAFKSSRRRGKIDHVFSRRSHCLGQRPGWIHHNPRGRSRRFESECTRRKVLDGIFVRVRPGIYVLPGVATRSDLDLRIACRLLSAVVSHESAAQLHGLQPIRAAQPVVSVSHRSTHSLPGVAVHQSTDLLDAHVTSVDGLPVTTPTRTIIDLAKVLGRNRLERVLDNALSSSIVDFDELYELFESLARKGKPGIRKLRTLLEDRRGGEFVSESELERRFTKLINDAGLPVPKAQFRADWLQRVNGRVDFAYVDQQLVIECDGRRWHSRFDAFESDRRRDNAAQIAGWRVLRFTWEMMREEPDVVVATVRKALQA